MGKEWILKTLNIDEDMIFWTENIGTPIEYFLSVYGSLIEEAIKKDEDPIKKMIDSDPRDKKGFNRYLELYL